MMAIADTRPAIAVPEAEYVRLLGYPRGWALEGRARELADWAREWFEHRGRPWIYVQPAATLELRGDAIHIDGAAFSSPRLHRMLHQAGAHTAVLVAVSAGPELEREAARLWDAERPDEYFFLEVFGSAVVEQLVTVAGARLCARADQEQLAVLPHYSPGYTEWPIEDQPRLLSLIARGSESTGQFPIALEAFESGMLRPKKSLLAVFGLTRHTDRVSRLTELRPCENCSFPACAYRRAPYRRDVVSQPASAPAENASAPVATRSLDPEARYTVNPRALKRWAAERLSIQCRTDGSLLATFRYDGTTCTNSGRPLEFRYEVALAPHADGYVIREQRCGPAPGDLGHQSMCRYISQRDELMASIAREQPLHGRPLNDVLTWPRPSCPAACYCDAESRDHKWGLVLETIHYALAHHPGVRPPDETAR